MKFGAYMLPTETSVDVRDLARWVEDLGFESLWVGEHTHMPIEDNTAYPGGGSIPEHYRHALDPFVALAAAATVSEQLLLGTAVCLATLRDPLVTAKAVASIDQLSHGRFSFGVGAGWNRAELRNHGIGPASRWQVLEEKLRAIVGLWTNEVMQLHGDYVDFSGSWQWPKPIQQPHPPILMGGNGPHAVEAAAQYCDGWLAREGRGSFLEKIEVLRRQSAAYGREEPECIVFACELDAESIKAYTSAGIRRGIIRLPSVPASDMKECLSKLAAQCRQYEDA